MSDVSHDALPKISVCLLTYNRAHALPATLDSLLNQTHGDFELLIHDDRSTDATEQVCREYESRDARVRYYKNPKNLRYAGNQSAAILRASHEYVAIVHDGDVYRSDLLEKWTRVLVAQPTAALVFNALEAMDGNGAVVRVFHHPYGQLVPGLQLVDEMLLRPDSPIFGIAMVRRSSVLSVAPFDPRIPTLADVDMWFRLLFRYDAAYIPEPLIRVAAREMNHHNHLGNWKVRSEHELIYALNSARRYPGQPGEVARLRLRMTPMIWKLRAQAIVGCLRRGKLRDASRGLAYAARRRDFTAGANVDSVVDWTGIAVQSQC
ncbi:MAG: hypothetical protein RLZZ450_6343 [Pseudomonadota bacterium]|jgi:glycosyltransferase involved in cell wall biosynthesis